MFAELPCCIDAQAAGRQAASDIVRGDIFNLAAVVGGPTRAIAPVI